MKKIAVVTGTRAEYGILAPVMRAIGERPGLELSLVVCGMHLSEEFGHTIDEIKNDGFAIAATVGLMPEDDTLGATVTAIGLGIVEMGKTWEELKPDIILLLGDRIEPLSAAIAGSYLNVPIAHIHGGDTSKGGLDEYARHAITQFSHIHFPATEKSAERIIRMGMEKWRVHMVGSPSLDVVLNQELPGTAELVSRYGIDFLMPLILVVQHPVTTQSEDAAHQMEITLEAVRKTGAQVLVVYPNSDAGGRSMIKVIRRYEKYSGFKAYPSLPRKDFLGLQKMAALLVGNSSSGMIESASFGLPVVNIGIRQEGRERGDNVIDVPHDGALIGEAIQKAMTDKEFQKIVRQCRNPYGDGTAGLKIAAILDELEITPALLQRSFND